MSSIVVFSHTTALEIHHHASVFGITFAKSRIESLPESIPSTAQIEFEVTQILKKLGIRSIDRPVHYLIQGGRKPKPTPHQKSHCTFSEIPKYSLSILSRNARVSSAELAVAQCIFGMDEEEAALLAFEVCGTYRSSFAKPDAANKSSADRNMVLNRGYGPERHSTLDRRCALDQNSTLDRRRALLQKDAVFDALPLTSVSRLQTFVKNNPSVYGIRKLEKALRYVCDNSASPRESQLVLALCLPMSKGGEGIPKPLMNFELECTEDARRITGKKKIRCDLYWPDAKLAIEYQSRKFHSGDSDRINDSRRKNALESMGIRVIEVTNEELNVIDDTDVIAKTVKKHLGMDKRCWTSDYLKKQMALRRNSDCQCDSDDSHEGVFCAVSADSDERVLGTVSADSDEGALGAVGLIHMKPPSVRSV